MIKSGYSEFSCIIIYCNLDFTIVTRASYPTLVSKSHTWPIYSATNLLGIYNPI